MLNYPNVDLSATRFNHKLPLYLSPVPDNHALAIDALSMICHLLHAYAFPPTILIFFCSSQDTAISVNSSYCSSLAPTTVVLRGITTVSISSNSSSALSKTTDTGKRKVSTSKISHYSIFTLGRSNNQSEIKKISQNVADFVSK